VRKIECRLHPSRIAYLDRPQARESLALSSDPICVATALANGKVGLRQFAKEGSFAQPATRSLMLKVHFSDGRNSPASASEVVVRIAGWKTAGKPPRRRAARPEELAVHR
jgi:hypothetical protein